MDFAPVPTQLAAGTEFGITLTTGKAPHQAVPPHGVLFQSPGASEERPTVLAAEGLFPGVNSHVNVELCRVAERQTARAAQERFLARVHLLVSLQVLTGAEPRVALAAGVGLVGGVPSQRVPLQVAGVAEAPTALVAAVRSFARVSPHVLLQFRGSVESRVAHATHQRLLAGVALDVAFQLALP